MSKMRYTIALVTGLAVILAATMVGGASSFNTTETGFQEGNTTTTEEEIITVTTEYPATEDSQAIRVSATVSPNAERVTDISLTIRNSADAFVDMDSFSITVTPSGATETDENVNRVGTGVQKEYQIESLSPGESVEIEFFVYPRVLDAPNQEIDAAILSYEFLRNGVTVPADSPGFIRTVTDISNSPVYEANELRSQLTDRDEMISELEENLSNRDERIDTLEGQLNETQSGNAGENGGIVFGLSLRVILAILFGIVGIGVGVFGLAKGNTGSEGSGGVPSRPVEKQREKLESLKTELETRTDMPSSAEEDFDEIIEELEEALED